MRNLQKDLDDTRKLSDAAAGMLCVIILCRLTLTMKLAERQREAARKKGTALRAEDLDEYRKLYVSLRLSCVNVIDADGSIAT